MRVVKLRETEPHFHTLDDVRHFFRTTIRDRRPPGKFMVTPGRIARGGLYAGEPLVFTYQARLVFTAHAGSGLVRNEDEEQTRYPSYFIVDLATLRDAEADLHDTEQQYNAAIGDHINLIGRGWNHLPDSVHTEELWTSLRASGAAGSRLRAEDADSAESRGGEGYRPEDVDHRPLVERQIRERRGQSEFRDALRTRYGDRCLVTGCRILAVLEAAHIRPYRGANDNHPENGLLLRADIHTLFDLDLLGIESDQLRVELHSDVLAEYGHLNWTTLGCSAGPRPLREALQLRYSQFRQWTERPA